MAGGIISKKDEKEAKEELRIAMEHLRESWFECLCIFTDARIEVNDYILGTEGEITAYPFHASFDELNVLTWIDGVLDALRKE